MFGSMSQIDDSLRWGGNDTRQPGAKRVVVDGVLEGEPPVSSIPEDFEVHILGNKIDKVIPATGSYDFVSAHETFIILGFGIAKGDIL